MNKKIFYLNGTSGYIGGELLKELLLKNKKVVTENRRLKDMKYSGFFIQIASPSDKDDFENKLEMKKSMIDDVKHNINISIKNNLVFIFCSSIAAEEMNNQYGIYKKDIENILIEYSKIYNLKYLILRIPRIYSKDRPKGLMKQLRNNEVPEKDFSNVIHFMELPKFIKKLAKIISGKIPKNKIIKFKKLKKLSIIDIKKRYEL